MIPLPNTDRDDGKWFLGVDRKHEGSTMLLYCELGNDRRVFRRIAFIQTRRELLKLYEHLTGVVVEPKREPTPGETERQSP